MSRATLRNTTINTTMIRVLIVGHKTEGWPLLDPAFRAQLTLHEITFTDDPTAFDVAVSDHLPRRGYLAYALHSGPRRPWLVWCDEPRYDNSTRLRRRGWGLLPDIHYMNIYTGDTFPSNFRYLAGSPPALRDADNCPDLPNRKAIALTTYRAGRGKWSFTVAGVERDLCVMRCELIAEGYRRGVVDVCGLGWPADIKVLEDSRRNSDGTFFGPWWRRKQEMLRGYAFNFAFENTNWPFYTTEKIWDPIAAGRLPIYWGRDNRIYDDFPSDSFIDYARCGGPGDLYDLMQRMSASEYRDRVNRCIQTMRDAVGAGEPQRTEAIVIEKLARRLHDIAS